MRPFLSLSAALVVTTMITACANDVKVADSKADANPVRQTAARAAVPPAAVMATPASLPTTQRDTYEEEADKLLSKAAGGRPYQVVAETTWRREASMALVFRSKVAVFSDSVADGDGTREGMFFFESPEGFSSRVPADARRVRVMFSPDGSVRALKAAGADMTVTPSGGTWNLPGLPRMVGVGSRITVPQTASKDDGAPTRNLR